ncbi:MULTISPECIES: TolC family protein [unclassified Methylophilus]|uniref:TolC family protein n=1 Tax=unclassified Methylophilus TaxID=2630143 RepID=UPI0023B347EA|nr:MULTISPECIES: TolC family protein [unclassified Methylophilus]MDF0379103.1 TolC family protein [Methylophilus sp. YYY-1]MDT7848666.1 TolC family protein [Methylophilus sp. VKM B-3414]
MLRRQQGWLCVLLMVCFEAVADSGVAPAIAWDQLSLQQAELVFAGNNRDLLAAKRAIESAEADTLIAGQKPNPVLSLGLSSLNLNRGQGNKNQNGKRDLLDQTYNSAVQVTQLYERGDKRALRSAVAESAVKASRLDLGETYRQQALAMATAYFDLKLAQESLLIQQANVSSYEKTLQAAQLRLKAGDVASADVARIRVDALRASNDLRQAEATVQKAQAMLAYLLGKDQDASKLRVTDPWPALIAEPSANPAAEKDTGWLPQRPDVKAAEARMEQAQQTRKLAESLKVRDFTWSFAYQHFPGQEPGSAPDTIGASLSIPLFTNYQYEGEAARAEVGYTSAIEARERVQAAAIAEMRQAKADLDAAIDKNRRFDQSILREAQNAADAAEFAYKHGAMNVMDLLDARRILRTLQLEAVSVKADYAKSLSAWLAATRQAFVYQE